MFGWPGETEADIVRTAQICNSLPIQNVKLHNLHVLKNTPLEKMFFSKEFTPIEFEEYCRFVGLFLANLSPEIYLHRLIALASRWDELIAPEWTRFKMTNYQKVIDYLNEHSISQGMLYKKPQENFQHVGIV
jgi:radical SAM superfamily enzyme